MAVIACLFGAILLIGINAQTVRRANNKWFWLDEAHEILNSCSVPYSTILLTGPPPECSPAPLYYILQKSVLTLVPIKGDSLLVFYRIISLASVFLCLALLFWTVQKYLHYILAILALTLMNNQQILHTYAAESRPYALWMLVFTACLILFSALAAKAPSEIRRPQRILLVVGILMLSLVSTAGVIQAAGFCIFILIFQNGIAAFNLRKQAFSRFTIFVFMASALLGFNYAVRACIGHEAGEWDLLKTRNWQLVAKVFSLLFPVYRTIPSVVFNLLLVIGLISPLFYYNQRHQLDARKKFALSIAMASGIQVLVAVLIGILVAGAHYYFIPRLFIFLIVLRTSLVVTGAYLLFDWLYRSLLAGHLSARLKTVGEVLLMLIVFAGSCGSLIRSEMNLRDWIQGEQHNSPKFRDFQCPEQPARIAVVQKSEDPLQFRLNFVTKLAEDLKNCNFNSKSNAPLLYYFPIPPATDQRTYDFEIKPASSYTAHEKLILMGHPITHP